jgi:3-deoxy-D-manno-octulosonate 8-phosphate phosphatase (KDO 8-P phosphatase)
MDGMVGTTAKGIGRALSVTEIRRRARNVRLVLTDNDGVLTDTGVYYSRAGEVMKRFSIRDGMAVELLRNAGIETGIVSGERSESVRKRAEKLRMRHVYLGVKDKRAHLHVILDRARLAVSHVAYIGDDVNDLGILLAVGASGLTGVPADAVYGIRAAAHYQCRLAGGHGAFREYADWILEHRGRLTTSG